MCMPLLAINIPTYTCGVTSCRVILQAGAEMNVGDYYQSAYKIKLNPKLPCLNVGASGKPTYVPAELATVKRGQRKLKLDERQQAQMIREAAIKPAVSRAKTDIAMSLSVSMNSLYVLPLLICSTVCDVGMPWSCAHVCSKQAC